jgi:hypothetical protein
MPIADLVLGVVFDFRLEALSWSPFRIAYIRPMGAPSHGIALPCSWPPKMKFAQNQERGIMVGPYFGIITTPNLYDQNSWRKADQHEQGEITRRHAGETTTT